MKLISPRSHSPSITVSPQPKGTPSSKAICKPSHQNNIYRNVDHSDDPFQRPPRVPLWPKSSFRMSWSHLPGLASEWGRILYPHSIHGGVTLQKCWRIRVWRDFVGGLSKNMFCLIVLHQKNSFYFCTWEIWGPLGLVYISNPSYRNRQNSQWNRGVF